MKDCDTDKFKAIIQSQVNLDIETMITNIKQISILYNENFYLGLSIYMDEYSQTLQDIVQKALSRVNKP